MMSYWNWIARDRSGTLVIGSLSYCLQKNDVPKALIPNVIRQLQGQGRYQAEGWSIQYCDEVEHMQPGTCIKTVGGKVGVILDPPYLMPNHFFVELEDGTKRWFLKDLVTIVSKTLQQ